MIPGSVRPLRVVSQWVPEGSLRDGPSVRGECGGAGTPWGYTSVVVKVVLVNPPSPPEFRVSRGLMGGFGMAVNPELLYPPIELAHVAACSRRRGTRW